MVFLILTFYLLLSHGLMAEELFISDVKTNCNNNSNCHIDNEKLLMLVGNYQNEEKLSSKLNDFLKKRKKPSFLLYL